VALQRKSRPPDRQPASGGGAAHEAPNAERVRERAIAMLARREHSRLEMRRKLLREGADPAVVDQVLDALKEGNLQSDLRYAEGIARLRGARFGSQRVAYDLRSGGVGPEAYALIDSLKVDDLRRAMEVWERKFGQAPADASERGRQMRFLQARGFPAAVVYKVVPRAQRDDPAA
jgi:regulatory protein